MRRCSARGIRARRVASDIDGHSARANNISRLNGPPSGASDARGGEFQSRWTSTAWQTYPVAGPVTWLPASDPPTFDIFANGHALWMVELSTAPELMDPPSENQRTDDNCYFGSDQPGAFAAGGTWPIPQDVWDRLGLAGRL